MVCDLPSLWDCGHGEIAVPLQRDSNQAAETLKYFTGIGQLLTNRLLTFDAKTMLFRTVPVRHRDSCAICGSHPTIRYAILSLHEGVHLNSFRILGGEVVDKEVHL
jgi:hypothetical protein